MRLSFRLGLIAVVLLGAGSVAAALIVRSNEDDHFHELQRDEAAALGPPGAGGRAALGRRARHRRGLLPGRGALQPPPVRVVGSSLLRRGALTATAYLQRVHGRRTARFERQPRLPDLRTRPRRAAARRPRRPEYFPVTYVVAEQPGKAPLGFDIGSDPERGPLLRRARDTRQAGGDRR